MFALTTFVVFTFLHYGSGQVCPEILKSYGVSPQFPGVVAHGIHSITVEDLRTFEQTVSIENSIPTVNRDLMSSFPIILNAPEIRRPKIDFRTSAMRVVDEVLSHMDNPNYDISQYSTLERLVHAFHMREVWSKAHVEYLKIKSNPPSNEVCKCVRDYENNGVMKMLRFSALAIREPKLMFGKTVSLNNGSVSYNSNVYNFQFAKHADPLKAPSDSMPPLKTAGGWGQWKKAMMDMKSSDDFELALFLYCSLNEDSIPNSASSEQEISDRDH